MKNIQLIAFLFALGLSGGVPFCVNAQAKNTEFSLRTDYDISKKELIESAKIIVPFVEARGSVMFTNPLMPVDFTNAKWNYGAAFSSQKLFPKLKLNLLVGNLSTSGSLSKLNSPALSSLTSPFCSSVRTSTLEVSLPQYNSFSSNQSYSFEAAIKPQKVFKQISLSIIYKTQTEEEIKDVLTASAQIKMSPWKKTELSVCSTGGIYPYKKKNVTTWFSDELFYHEGEHFCINNQLFFNSPHFSSLFIHSIYQSPFGDSLFTYRSENQIKLEHFTFNLHSFYNPHDELVTSSDKKLKPLLQVCGGIQYKTFIHSRVPFQIITGINSQGDFNLAEKNHTFKTAVGVKYSSSDFSGSLSSIINTNLENQTEGIKTVLTGGSIESSNSFYINDFTTSANAKFSFTQDSKQKKWTYSEKLGINFEYEMQNNKVSFTNKNSITFTQKPGDVKNKIGFTSSLTAKFQFRFCSLHVHLEFQE